jgi:Major Facilitator Superfamily
MKARGKVVRNPFLTVLREDWRNILRVIALRVVESCAYYLTATYLLSYITKREPTDRTIALAGVVIASVIAVGSTLFAGRLTDRVGRRRVYLAACILAVAFGMPMFLMANTGHPVLIVALFIIGIGIIHATPHRHAGRLVRGAVQYLHPNLRGIDRLSGRRLDRRVRTVSGCAAGEFVRVDGARAVLRSGRTGRPRRRPRDQRNLGTKAAR